MRQLGLAVIAACALLANTQRGLPARSTPDNYVAKASVSNFTVAAEVMDPEQIRNEFSTTLVPTYQVLEVAVYPSRGSTVDISALDFAVRVDGRLIRPAAPRTIAARNQRKARSGGRDITLWPAVGVSTGTYGTGANVGVGVGVGDNRPRPASSDRDRGVMETELDDRALQDGVADKAVAGYLYFPVGETKATSMELVYQHDQGELKLPLLLPKKK
jgi:hypothetical protein